MPQLPGVDPRRQVVCHVDVDCFYAACERLREPKLRDEPVVVGMGYEPGADHGAVATASYEARGHGVESAMAISEALKRLPRRADSESGEAETGYYRPVDMAYYESVSEDVQAVLDDTAETVRNVSIDEAYLDLGDLAWDDAEAFGRQLKADIEAAAGVVASVGIAPTMATAKLASDAEKPDGLVIVDPDSVAAFLKPIPVAELHGVGPVTAAELRERGYETAGDVAAADETALVDTFGERGRDIYRQARGEDDRVVEPKGRPKSLSSESAFPEPTDDSDRKRRKLTALAADVTERATAKDALYRTVGIKVVEPPFDVHTRERSLSGPVDDPELVEEIAVDLLAEFDDPAVRKLGVRVSNLSFDDREQATLGQWADGTADQEPVRSSHVRRSGETDTQLELSQFE